jgi:hypothetical protein
MKMTAFSILLLLICGSLGAQEEEQRNQQEEAAYRLEIAQDQYQAGDYQNCLQTLNGYIADHKSKTFIFPHAQMAQVYRLRALLAYAFRGDGDAYRNEVREYLRAALVEAPEVQLGSPSEIPVFIQELFYQVLEEYLGRFSRTSRRFTFGLLGALVIDPTLLVDPSFLQPGIYFSYNLSEHWSLNTDLQIPLSWPIWDAIRGQVGFSWHPDFSITRINTAIALAYAFSLTSWKPTPTRFRLPVRLSGSPEWVWV